MDRAMGVLSSVIVAYDVRKLAIQDLDISRPIYSILPTINQSLFPIKSCVVRCPGQTDWGVSCQVNFLTERSTPSPTVSFCCASSVFLWLRRAGVSNN